METRCRKEINGVSRPDAIWMRGPDKDPLPSYTINLSDATESVGEKESEADKTKPDDPIEINLKLVGENVRLGEDFLKMHIRPVTNQHAGDFIYNWCGIVETGLTMERDQARIVAAEKAENLFSRLKSGTLRLHAPRLSRAPGGPGDLEQGVQ